jgi:glycosyltransferase involved in cell wall biosynthesis
LGNAILEAMALGIPVIATRVGGVPELIDDGRSGRLVAPDDATGLAEAIVEAIEDSALRSRWAVAARAVASGFDRDRMIALTLEQYRDVSRRR